MECDLAHCLNSGVDLDIDLIDRREMPPLGAGEAATRPARTPLADEVFNATGARLCAVPFTSERMKRRWSEIRELPCQWRWWA